MIKISPYMDDTDDMDGFDEIILAYPQNIYPEVKQRIPSYMGVGFGM